MLRLLEWHVETVYDHGWETEPIDARLLAKARNHGFTLVTFDKFRGQSGAEIAGEMRERGGKLIRIGGGPEQPPARSVGKLLFHQDKWEPFLQKEDGRVNIGDIKEDSCQLLSRAKLIANFGVRRQRQFEKYLEGKEEKRRQPPKRRPRKKIPEEQANLGGLSGGTP